MSNPIFNPQPIRTNYENRASAPGWGDYQGAPMDYPQYRPKNGMAIAGFVLAVIGLGFLIPLFGWLAIPFVLLGLVLSIFAFARARAGARFRGLALAGLLIASLTLVAGTVLNVVVYRNAVRSWNYVDTTLAPPTGAAAEALIGEWAFEGTPWFRFDADGTGQNLSDGERFNWGADGTFRNAQLYSSWVVDGDTLTVTWITGNTFTYQRVTR